MCPAHGKDVDIVGLVSAFPVKSQAYIAHALQHLHTMNHTVEDILEGKLKDVVEYLEPVVDNEDDLRDMTRTLYASEFADTLAGLNGIARIHTGSFPQDKT
jgi:phage-related protein